MSLLLDALKKAAKEKQSADSGNADTGASEGLELESLDELTADNLQHPGLKADPTANRGGISLPDDSDDEPEGGASATPLTVSDEALEVLVHKANRQFRSSQRLIWGGALVATLFILITGGVYFYYNMAEDVASIERKHKLVMRAVTDTQLSRSVTEKIEKQIALEAQQKKQASGVTKMVQVEKEKKQNSKKSNNKIVIKKTKKLDPIDVLATKAWNAYEDRDYEAARSIYTKILGREENNRDALLGVAAIAVKQDDIESAKSIYKELVQLNPRDPIAVAALSNLEKSTLGELGETKLKLMIRKNSEPSHLYFALGNIYSRQSRWPEAQQSYFNAWQSDTNNADYAFNLAVSLDQMGKQKEAIKFYKTSLTNAKSGNTQFSIEVAESRLQQLSDGQE